MGARCTSDCAAPSKQCRRGGRGLTWGCIGSMDHCALPLPHRIPGHPPQPPAPPCSPDMQFMRSSPPATCLSVPGPMVKTSGSKAGGADCAFAVMLAALRVMTWRWWKGQVTRATDLRPNAEALIMRDRSPTNPDLVVLGDPRCQLPGSSGPPTFFAQDSKPASLRSLYHRPHQTH